MHECIIQYNTITDAVLMASTGPASYGGGPLHKYCPCHHSVFLVPVFLVLLPNPPFLSRCSFEAYILNVDLVVIEFQV